MARLPLPGLTDSLIILALAYTEFYKFLLDLTNESPSKNIVVLSCSITLLTRQTKSTVTVQSKLSDMDAGGEGGAR